MFKGYAEFAQRVRFVDFAVGLVMGGAFFAAVSSLIGDVVMPIAGWYLTGYDVRDLFTALDGKTYQTLKAARDAGAPVVAWGLLLTNASNVAAVIAAVYATVKLLNKLF